VVRAFNQLMFRADAQEIEMSCSGSKALLRTVVLILVAIAGGSAAGQPIWFPQNLEDAFQPDFIRRDLAAFERDLHLDAEQRQALASAFATYEAAFKQGCDALRAVLTKLSPALGHEDPADAEKRDELRSRLSTVFRQLEDLEPEGQSPAAAQERQRLLGEMERIRLELKELQSHVQTEQDVRRITGEIDDHVEQWRSQRSALSSKFIAEVVALLNEDQRALWPALDRRLIREKTLGRGRLAGESIDLRQIIAQLKLNPAEQSSVGPILDAYELRLDEALRARNELLSSSQAGLNRAIQAQDEPAARSIAQEQIERRIAVRAINDEFTQTLAAALPEEISGRLVDAYRMRGYPRVFRPTQTQRMFEAARQLQGLDLAIINAITELERSYSDQLRTLNEHLLNVVREHEPEELKRRTLRRMTNKGQPPDTAQPRNDPILAAFAARTELNDRFDQQLETILPPEKFNELPGARSGSRPRAQRDARQPQ
jgi:hypothetical protein